MPSLLRTVRSTQDPSTEALLDLIEAVRAENPSGLIVLACDANGIDAARVDPVLRSLDLPVCGGVFPSLVVGRQALETGYVVAGLAQDVEIALFKDVGRCDAPGACVIELPECVAEAESLLVLFDGLSSTIERLISDIYDQIGPDRSVLGGGAGSMSLARPPCLFTNEGMLGDALQVVGLPTTIRTSVRHGWEKLAGPFLVTESSANVLQSLNYRPAFDVYREVVEPYSEASFDDGDFLGIAQTYPFGLEQLDEALLVRVPLLEQDGGMVCGGHIPENAMVYVLRGEPDALIAAAGSAASSAEDRRGIDADVLVFDCITREHFLKDRFRAELDAIRAPFTADSHLIGALSMGEVANSEGGSIQHHNKTVVVGVGSGELG